MKHINTQRYQGRTIRVMRYGIMALLLFLGMGLKAQAQSPGEPRGDTAHMTMAEHVTPQYFDSEVLPPAANVSQTVQDMLPSLQLMTEGQLIHMALNYHPQMLGIDPSQVSDVSDQLIDLYGKITTDPVMRYAASALPYCLTGRRPTRGHYFLYTPEHIDDDTRLLVFLHGKGGNFQYYSWQLAKAFPDDVIILPSWTASWEKGKGRYLFDAIADAENKLGTDLPRPWLIGLSDGGRGALRIYRQSPNHFAGLVLISTLPAIEDIRQLGKATMMMIHGQHDQRYPLKRVQRIVEADVEAGNIQLVTVPADHFLMLTHDATCFGLIQDFMQSHAQ